MSAIVLIPGYRFYRWNIGWSELIIPEIAWLYPRSILMISEDYLTRSIRAEKAMESNRKIRIGVLRLHKWSLYGD